MGGARYADASLMRSRALGAVIMKLLRSSPLLLTSLLALACSEDRGALNPSSGNVAASSAASGADGGAGGAGTGTGGTGVTSTGGGDAVTGTGGGAQSSTSSAGGGGAAPGTGGGGGAGGSGGAGGAGGSGGAGGAGLPVSCTNEQLDDGETAVDCGGDVCNGCDAGLACLDADDCLDSICTDLFCVAGTCVDDVTNGAETDEDCGGGTCDPCDVNLMCADGFDCTSSVCSDLGFCSAPACDDMVQNGDETDEDCGGTCPGNCANNESCLVGEDCISGVCPLLVCLPPTCSDGVMNGDETDIDCGGSSACNDCGAGKACDGDGDCLSEDCSAVGVCLCPSGMTTIPVQGGGSYCIDPTEVTYKEYEGFVLANPPQVDPVICAFNTEYVPTLWPPSATALSATYEQRPVRHVDWCDAAAYCEWRGKRLCGAIEGGPANLDELAMASEDQWFNACTAIGINTYPYSGAFDTSQCTESVGDIDPTLPSAVRDSQGTVLSTCEGGFSNVFQMSGNMAEWVDACDAAVGGADGCIVRGGSFLTAVEADLTCAATDSVARNTKSTDIGIRCCQ